MRKMNKLGGAQTENEQKIKHVQACFRLVSVIWALRKGGHICKQFINLPLQTICEQSRTKGISVQ